MPLSQVKPSREELHAELQRLRRHEFLFGATQKIGRFGYCDWDYSNGRINSCSPEYARIFGMNMAEVIASQDSWEKVLEQIHPDDREHYASSYREQLGKGSHEIEYRVLRKDGGIRHIKEIGVVYYDNEGNEIDAMGLLQDITERKEREQELENRDTIVRQFELIPEVGHYIWNLDTGKYKYISPGYARIFGITTEEFLQRITSLGDDIGLVHEDDQDRLTKIFQNRKVDRNDVDAEYRIRRANGEIRWVREQSIATWDSTSDGNLSIGVLQDVTEQKYVEQSLRHARDKLETLVDNRTRELANTIERLQREIKDREKISSELEAKNAELERFAYTVSHDLKSPLVTIKGFAGLLAKDIAEQNSDKITDDLGKICGAADTMGNLLNDLLELSRVGRIMGEPVSCDLTQIAEQAAAFMTGETAKHQAEIIIEDMPIITGDETRLIEVFQNLVENAIKFMGEQTSPRVQVGADERDGYVHCFVRDNGMGIEKEFHEQVFGLFERLSIDVDGTGIGLALVKRIVEVHGGKIWIESEGSGQGSKVIFTLPRSD
jgi:PAS domain S-box-containing protein